jgi:sigma-B regulation protein RsbU (phosphoserine phosphatase)
MGPVLAQRDLLAAWRPHLLALYAALNVEVLERALVEACRDLLGCRHVTVLTYQRHSRRARLRFTNHPDLVPYVDDLLPFDEGPLCVALRTGAADEAVDGDPLVWSTLEGACVVSARAVRPLVFENEPYGGLLFHTLDQTLSQGHLDGAKADSSEPFAGAVSGGAEGDGRPAPAFRFPSAVLGASQGAGPDGPHFQPANPAVAHSVAPGECHLTCLLDLLAEAVAVALMKCEIDEERSRQVVDSRVRLSAITRMGRVLNGLDLDVLLQRMMDVALSAVNGQVGSIVLARGGRLKTAVEWGLDDAVVRSILYPSGRSVMEEVYETKLPVLVTDVKGGGRVRVSRQDVNIESYLCIPLHTNRGALGVLNIINSAAGRSFSDRDLDLLLTICNLASAALENAILHQEAMAKQRMETQLDIAAQIQKSLLPETAPTVAGFDMAGWNHPCEAVGGDYFDFVQLEDGRLGVVIGDVSGHGLGPALLMTSARAALRSFIACDVDPHEVLIHLNRLLSDQVMSAGAFITIVFAALNTKERKIHFTNAGHPPPLVFNAASLSIREPMDRGMVLGVDPDADYPVGKPILLSAGDIIAFYTDGVLDVTNEAGECFGKPRLVKTIVANRQLPARGIIDSIRAEIYRFSRDKPPADDLTLVLVKAL